ncbi:acyl CoA binding protein-domain-containing protein [Gilbertella persicaria]|uniref:acyl CoA binding protein-domain-containing protein n=1 Tax=Gilbertella persicaria TaxID=101096 RepID=UPI00221EFD4F|nr:acyl CoA binding protein-domain-containing protein [Gilbertella persicaria]KAI8075927.1 acyl CoA binding protein-domain-containing protein [Gilbertella persicaria]
MIHSHRHINQQYNKALFIVQHLPISSNVQPTKEQKLQLYSLYKQASQGDINTPRPGIFDVVGRSKWDAWKKLEGMSELEAKHRYVQMLLQVAKEVCKYLDVFYVFITTRR